MLRKPDRGGYRNRPGIPEPADRLTGNRGTGSQELARRVVRVAAPDHGHDPARVDHGPAVLPLDANQAVRPGLHAGQLLVLGGGEADLPGLVHHDEGQLGRSVLGAGTL